MWSTHFSALLFALGDAAWLCVCALDLTENSKNFSTFDYHLDDDGAWHVLLQLANCSTLFFLFRAIWYLYGVIWFDSRLMVRLDFGRFNPKCDSKKKLGSFCHIKIGSTTRHKKSHQQKKRWFLSGTLNSDGKSWGSGINCRQSDRCVCVCGLCSTF